MLEKIDSMALRYSPAESNSRPPLGAVDVVVSALSRLVWQIAMLCLWGAGTAHAEAGQRWCVVAGGFKYEAFDRASALADRLRAQDVETVGIHDTRDITEMAWGELVVIAQQFAGPEARRSAAAAVKALKKRKINVYAKPCTAAQSKALKSAAEIAPRPVLPTTSLEVDPEHWPRGCFGWSPKKATAACVVHEYRSVESAQVMVFPGSDEPAVVLSIEKAKGDNEFESKPLSAGALRGLRKSIAQLGLVDIDGFKRSLGAGETLHYASPRISVQWTQKLVREQQEDLGESGCPLYSNRIVLRCRGKTAVESVLFEDDDVIEGDSTEVYLLPGEKLLVAHGSSLCGDEAGSIYRSSAKLIDLPSFCGF